MGGILHYQHVASTVKLSHLNIDNIIFVAHYPSLSYIFNIIMLPVLKFLTNYGCHLYFLNIECKTVPNETIKGINTFQYNKPFGPIK